jgi:hypothetical protein
MVIGDFIWQRIRPYLSFTVVLALISATNCVLSNIGLCERWQRMNRSKSLLALDRSTGYNFGLINGSWCESLMWSQVSAPVFVMPHSGRVLTVFTRISTRVLRALQSPTFELIEFLVDPRIGSSLDSALLVRGQIDYWIQMWVGVCRLFVGFGIAKG